MASALPHVTKISPFCRVVTAVNWIGADGALAAKADSDTGDEGPVPAAEMAETRTTYVDPSLTVIVAARVVYVVGASDFHTPPSAWYSTRYFEIGLPLAAAAVHEMLTLVFDLVTICGFPGAPGRTRVATALDSAEYGPGPAPFTAATRKR